METVKRNFRFINLPIEGSKSDAQNIIPNSILVIGEIFPGIITLQIPATGANLYINDYACGFFGRNKNELLEMGKTFYSAFSPLEEQKYAKREINILLKRNIYDQPILFFQRLRANENQEYKWFLTTSQLLSLSKQSENFILNISILIGNCNYMGQKLDGMVKENLLLRKYYHHYKQLSEREREIMELISKGFSSLKISELLCISIHTVNNHRKNILQKIGKKNLNTFLKFNSVFPSNPI